MGSYKLIIIPMIGGLIGWFTNYLAVKMLFRPRKKINFLGLKLQGVFPKRQKDLAVKLGEIVSKELFSSDDILEIFNNKFSIDQVKKILNEKLDKVLSVKLPELFPMLAAFITPEMIQKIKKPFLEELLKVIDEFKSKIKTGIDQNVDIKKIVEEKVLNFSVDKLEVLVLSIMKQELKFIEYIGFFIGLMIGIVQVLIYVF